VITSRGCKGFVIYASPDQDCVNPGQCLETWVSSPRTVSYAMQQGVFRLSQEIDLRLFLSSVLVRTHMYLNLLPRIFISGNQRLMSWFISFKLLQTHSTEKSYNKNCKEFYNKAKARFQLLFSRDTGHHLAQSISFHPSPCVYYSVLMNWRETTAWGWGWGQGSEAENGRWRPDGKCRKTHLQSPGESICAQKYVYTERKHAKTSILGM